MLCEKNRCRGTLFEYELMHNFHYFLCVLSSPLALLPLPAPPREEQGLGGGREARTVSHPILYPFFLSLPVLQWRRVEKGGWV